MMNDNNSRKNIVESESVLADKVSFALLKLEELMQSSAISKLSYDIFCKILESNRVQKMVFYSDLEVDYHSAYLKIRSLNRLLRDTGLEIVTYRQKGFAIQENDGTANLGYQYVVEMPDEERLDFSVESHKIIIECLVESLSRSLNGQASIEDLIEALRPHKDGRFASRGNVIGLVKFLIKSLKKRGANWQIIICRDNSEYKQKITGYKLVSVNEEF